MVVQTAKFYVALRCQIVATLIFLVSHIFANTGKVQAAMTSSLDKPFSEGLSTTLQQNVPEVHTLYIAHLWLKYLCVKTG